MSYEKGFEPVCDRNSRVLILGSFPSVKSRAEGFYYGNPQNRFWRTVSGFFGEERPVTMEEKRDFLLRRGIALWDIVASCEIEGSMDASIKEAAVIDLPSLLRGSAIRAVFCNGAKSYELLGEAYPALLPLAVKLPSTSPANPRFDPEKWYAALRGIFRCGTNGAEQFKM